jgi:hypothetical protein
MFDDAFMDSLNMFDDAFMDSLNMFDDAFRVKYVFETFGQVKFEVNLNDTFDCVSTPYETIMTSSTISAFKQLRGDCKIFIPLQNNALFSRHVLQSMLFKELSDLQVG